MWRCPQLRLCSRAPRVHLTEGEAGDQAGWQRPGPCWNSSPMATLLTDALPCPAGGCRGLSAPQEAQVPVGHACAGGAAGRLVVVVDAEAGLHHHVAVVVPVLAALICSGREGDALSTRGRAAGRRASFIRPAPGARGVCVCTKSLRFSFYSNMTWKSHYSDLNDDGTKSLNALPF